MKTGINNIFTSFWFILMILCSGTLTYIAFNKNLFTSDLIFIAKIVMGFMVLLFIAIIFYTFYKFRILVITKNNIISIFPFLLKKEKIELNKVSIKMSNWTGQKGTIYRLAEVKNGNNKISFSDMEFENFDSLTNQFYNNNYNEKVKADINQAKGNISSMKFNFYSLIGFLIFLIGNTIFNSGYHLIIVLFFLINFILLYATYKRKLKYDRILKRKK